MKRKVRVQLKRDHYLNGILRNAGELITINEFSAKFLIKRGDATAADSKDGTSKRDYMESRRCKALGHCV